VTASPFSSRLHRKTGWGTAFRRNYEPITASTAANRRSKHCAQLSRKPFCSLEDFAYECGITRVVYNHCTTIVQPPHNHREPTEWRKTDENLRYYGGGGGIRTHGPHRPTVFKTAPLNHSGTPPRFQSYHRNRAPSRTTSPHRLPQHQTRASINTSKPSIELSNPPAV
jgi:hypothetical protein